MLAQGKQVKEVAIIIGAAVTHVVAGTQRVDRFGVDVWRPELAVDQDGQGLVDGGQDVKPRDNGAGVDEGIFEGGVARDQLRLQEARVGDLFEEGDVHAVGRGHVLDGDGFQEGHVDRRSRLIVHGVKRQKR